MANTSEAGHRRALTPQHRRWQDLRAWSLIVGLLALPLPPFILFGTLGHLASDITLPMQLARTAWGFGATEVLSLGLGSIYLAYARTRGFLRLRGCVTLGAVVGCTMMFFSGLSRALAMKSGWGIGGPSHFFDDFANNLTGYIAFNCFLAIPGLLGGWIFWRIPAGRTQRPPAQLYRRWEDLRGWRLSLGLCLGPIAMALIYDLIRVLDMGVTAEEFVAETILILVIGIGWTMISGWAYLLAVARQRRRIARRECLLLGTIVAVLMPLALLVIVFAMQGQAGVAETFGTEGSTEWPIVSALFVFSLFGVLGVLGGWLFWRFGVRPTPEPDPDVSAVFE